MSGLSLLWRSYFPGDSSRDDCVRRDRRRQGHSSPRRPQIYYRRASGIGFAYGGRGGSAVSSALPALKLSVQNPEVLAALNRSIYWSSLQGLGNGFLFLVLVISALITEMIDRNFGRAAIWCLIASIFSWFGLMHSRFCSGARSPCTPPGGSPPQSLYFPPGGGEETCRALCPTRNLWRSRMSLRYAGLTLEGAYVVIRRSNYI